ncbi:MAG: cysteine synthase A [Clostridia bacterium]|nr:cysteine synthase A [Clostridia bacterium]
MRIFKNICELVGNTPLMELSNIEKRDNLKASVLCKLECFNPTSSAKDRAAAQMIADAENKGILKEGSVIIEPTSGNTGIGLAAIGSSKGYKVIIVMPETMSKERIMLTKAYGAEVVLTDGSLGMKGAIEKAKKLAQSYESAFIPDQFSNPANPESHYLTTGPEIWEDTAGRVDVFVAGIGTGGTISGVGKYLKEKNPDIKIIGIEPKKSPLITAGVAGGHGIQGIGANFVPDNFDKTICDEIITVSDEDAYLFSRRVAAEEGIAVGISSGAAVCGAIELAKRKENEGKTIVALLTDTGERYLSTTLYEGE